MRKDAGRVWSPDVSWATTLVVEAGKIYLSGREDLGMEKDFGLPSFHPEVERRSLTA